jgi:glycosyltransferase involved in cell wall biosynthesis
MVPGLVTNGGTGSAALPRISVVTASRNTAKTIAALYQSLEGQTCRDFEWVVADAQSTDGTVGLLEEFASRSPWVRFVSAPDAGIYDGLNKAIALCAGEYYVVAGADDIFAPDALSRYGEYAAAGNADVVLARVRRGDRVIGGFRPRRAWLGPSRVFEGSHSLGTMIRKDLHRRFGRYSSRFPLLADVYFLKTLLRSGAVTFASVDFVAGTFAEGGATTTQQLQLLAENWQIQMLTEPSPGLQTLLLFAKMLLRYPAIRAQLRASRAS